MYQRVFEPGAHQTPSGFTDVKRLVVGAAAGMTTSEVLELADMLHDIIRERRRHQFECDPTQACEHQAL